MDSIQTEIREAVAAIALDDGKANALSPELIAGIHHALDVAEKDAKAVVITGRPGRFSAGFDLKVLRQGPEAAVDLVTAGGQLFLRFLEFPLPIVVGCTGHAIAAGAIALMTSDYRVGAKGEFQIGMNETAIGMTLPDYAIEFARERLSKRHFDRSIIHAEMYGPEGAIDAGFLDRIVAPDEVVAEAFGEAVRLAASPQPAFGNNKRLAHAAAIERIRGPLVENVRSLMSR